jgi:hypothetical protein
MKLDWYEEVTTADSSSHTIFYVEALDSCYISSIYPFESEFDEGLVNYYYWTTENMYLVQDYVFDDDFAFNSNTDSYKQYWNNTQELDDMKNEVMDDYVNQTIFYDSDYISDVYY